MTSNEKEFVSEAYKSIFRAIADIPDWHIKTEEWLFIPEPLEKLTRDEAFKGVYKKGKKR